MDFEKDCFVKIVNISGDYHYGFIQEVKARGYCLIISLEEEGDSAIEYEARAGTISSDWETLLSPTEKTLIPLLAQNLKTNEIAAELSITPATVRSHIRTLRLKLQLLNRKQLVAFTQGVDKQIKKREEGRSQWKK